MTYRAFAISSILALVACQKKEPAKSQPPPASSVAPKPTEAPKLDEPIDVHGIVVTFRKDGMIELKGRDKFGAAIDTVYENADFLRNALPVLDAGLTADQSAGLRKLLPPK